MIHTDGDIMTSHLKKNRLGRKGASLFRLGSLSFSDSLTEMNDLAVRFRPSPLHRWTSSLRCWTFLLLLFFPMESIVHFRLHTRPIQSHNLMVARPKSSFFIFYLLVCCCSGHVGVVQIVTELLITVRHRWPAQKLFSFIYWDHIWKKKRR